MNRLIHRSWGEGFRYFSLDLSIRFSRSFLDFSNFWSRESRSHDQGDASGLSETAYRSDAEDEQLTQ